MANKLSVHVLIDHFLQYLTWYFLIFSAIVILQVLLDWAPTEDGSHLLTVSVGSKVLIYAPVSEEMAGVTNKEEKATPAPARGLLQKSKSVTMVATADQIQWIKLRSLDLTQENIQCMIPTTISWVRDGLLVLGLGM